MLTRAWFAAARTRERLRPADRPREQLVKEHAAGRSFADVGALWSVHGAIAFAAEEAGATSVTALDVMAPTPEYEAERARRASQVSFVQGDLHDPATVERAGPHDVVWCSGVLYHAPNPLLTLERLRALTGETLLLATETIPQPPWLRGACVFAPPTWMHPAHTEAFDPARGYVNWYWGITRDALSQMLLATGFEPVETHGGAFHRTVVARAR